MAQAVENEVTGFLAKHWHLIRTTNPIEPTFATVRLRTAKTRGCLSRTTALTLLAFQLARCAEKAGRRLRGYKRFPEIIAGIPFIDGKKDTMPAA